jgi:putative glycosyltransferase (TIGR04348 family)
MRWAGFLRENGHRVEINTQYDGSPCDLMIALHAWRAAPAVNLYRSRYPHGPLVVALGGTDVNTFLASEPEVTLGSMEQADALVCLHDQIGEKLPSHLLGKLHVICQSAKPLASPRKPSKRNFDICVIGHLREEKDPLRAAFAVRLLPEESRVRLLHLGKAHNDDWARAAVKEQSENPRYHWLGDVPGWRVRRELAKTRLIGLTSNQEGGANVISEAIVAGVPIIASNIPGNTGLLGKDYPGLYPLGDERALAEMFTQAENDPAFLKRLGKACQALRPKFLPMRESDKWNDLITAVGSQAQARRQPS